MKILKEKWTKTPIAVKASTSYAICSVLQRCLSFITLPLFTRLLSTEQYGQLTIYQSWSGILSIFLTLNLAYGSFSTAMVKYEKDRDGYISAVEGICLGLAGMFMAIYLPLRGLWNKLFELPTLMMCLMVIELLGSTAIQLWSGKKRFEFKYKSVVCVTLLMSILSPVIAYYLVISTTEKGYARILGYSSVTVFVGGIFYVFNALKGKKILYKEYWKYALGFNLPLLFYYLSQVVFNQSDRIMISHMVGKDKAAIYGVAYSLATILTFVLNAINNSYVPWYYGKIKEGKQEENKKVSLIIALIMSVLLSGVIWFAPEVISLLAGEEYVEAKFVVPPVAISILLLFYAQLFINVEFYYEEKKKLIWASLWAALINLLLNWVFIRKFGFVSAAYTTLASYVIFVIANYLAMKKVLNEKGIKDDAYNYKMLIMLFVVFCCISIIGVCIYNNFVIRVIIASVVMIGVLLKGKSILCIIRSIKKRT